MPTLEMNTVAGLISLDEYLDHEQGFQVLKGLTGMGLPAVDTDWFESAGDGAHFRGSRTRSRDLDLPLWLNAPDRAGLKLLVSKLGSALSGPVQLRWIDGAETWTLDTQRVGGGNTTYGEDTTGETDLFMVVTLRAGDPYWKRATTQTKPLTNGANTFNSAGNAPSEPTWTLTGPLTKFTAVSADGRKLGWTGNLAAGQTRTITTGKCVGSDGTNFYNELDTAPKFWRIPGNSSTAQVTLTGTGSATATWNPKNWMVI